MPDPTKLTTNGVAEPANVGVLTMSSLSHKRQRRPNCGPEAEAALGDWWMCYVNSNMNKRSIKSQLSQLSFQGQKEERIV